jgi:prophage tail gpP-like protein
MAKPTPGKFYTIVDENTLNQVAKRAYGDATLWPDIWEANQTRLRSGDQDLIFPGEVIFIPELPGRDLSVTADPSKDNDGVYINLDGREIRPESFSALRTIDTVANAVSASVSFPDQTEDPTLYEKVKPKSFTKTTVSIGGERIFTGLLYGRGSQSSQGGRRLNLSFNTASVDLVASSLKPPFEFNNIKIDTLCKKFARALGRDLIVDVNDVGAAFEVATAQQGESRFSFLQGLAKQRGLLLTCDIDGNLVLTRANIDGQPVATLEENVTPGVIGWNNEFNDRERFNVYRAVADGPFGTEEATAQDNSIPRSRFKTISANEANAGDIQAAVDWAKNKTTADALGFELTVADWRNNQNAGKIWEENTIVTVISPTLFIPDGFNFLINRVQYILGSNGRTTRLSLVPPTSYTQGEIVEPW